MSNLLCNIGVRCFQYPQCSTSCWSRAFDGRTCRGLTCASPSSSGWSYKLCSLDELRVCKGIAEITDFFSNTSHWSNSVVWMLMHSAPHHDCLSGTRVSSTAPCLSCLGYLPRLDHLRFRTLHLLPAHRHHPDACKRVRSRSDHFFGGTKDNDVGEQKETRPGKPLAKLIAQIYVFQKADYRGTRRNIREGE
jgi:hypothetical protein